MYVDGTQDYQRRELVLTVPEGEGYQNAVCQLNCLPLHVSLASPENTEVHGVSTTGLG